MPPLPPVTRATRPSRRPTATRPARRIINPRTARQRTPGRAEDAERNTRQRVGVSDMGRGLHISTEFAFLLSGVFITLVAWALNLLGTLAVPQGPGHGVSAASLWLFV